LELLVILKVFVVAATAAAVVDVLDVTPLLAVVVVVVKDETFDEANETTSRIRMRDILFLKLLIVHRMKGYGC
jgi:hypothetical protein